MPTNVVRPDWHCDVCGTSYGESRARAEECEALLVPLRPRVGATFLRASYSGIKFIRVVDAAERPSSRIGRESHTWPFRISDQRDWLYWDLDWPEAGYLSAFPGSFNRDRNLSDHRFSQEHEPDAIIRLAREVGLPVVDDRVVYRGRLLVAPLEAATRALLDVLEISPRLSERLAPRDAYASALIAAEGLAERAAVLHACRPRSDDDVRNDLARWWAGEPIAVELPRFGRTTRRWENLTPSKLKKHQRDALAAAGVEWPARYNQDDFVRKILPKVTLPMEDETHPRFPLPTIAVLSAKGGVGKSTCAAAFAATLARGGWRVLIVDCDPMNSSQAALWDLGPIPLDEDALLLRPTPTYLAGVFALSPGQFVPSSEAADWASRTSTAWFDFVASNTDVSAIDVVVLDLPAGGEPFLDRVYGYSGLVADTVALVITGHRLVLEATERWAAARFREEWKARTQLIENLSHLPDSTRVIGKDKAIKAFAQRVGVPLIGHLPIVDDHLVLAAWGGASEIAKTLYRAAAVVDVEIIEDDHAPVEADA